MLTSLCFQKNDSKKLNDFIMFPVDQQKFGDSKLHYKGFNKFQIKNVNFILFSEKRF